VRPLTQGILALLGSLAVHATAGSALLLLARRPKPPPRPPPVTISVVEKRTEKPPENPKPPEPEKPKAPPKPVPMKLARAQKPPPPKQQLPPPPQPLPPPTAAPPPPSSEAKVATASTPVVLPGITLESTSAGGGFAVNVGNTLYGDMGKKGREPEAVKPYKAARYAPAAQVSELPVQIRREELDLRKYYPPEALKKEFEGDVVLKLLIDSDGSLAKVEVISDPGEGLGAAAVKAAREQLHFSPGKLNGVAVATSVPYVMHFVIN
jgi:protein TonB